MDDMNLVHQRIEKVEIRIESLEEFAHHCAIREAATAERDKAMVKWMASIDSEIKKSTDNSTWLVRLVFGGLIMGALAFMATGGMNVGP